MVADSPGGWEAVLDDSGGLTIKDPSGKTVPIDGRHTVFDTYAMSPDGRFLAAPSSGGTIRLWSTADGRLLDSFSAGFDFPRELMFSPDSQRLAAVGDWIRLWSSTDLKQIGDLTGTNGLADRVVFDTNSSTIVAFSTQISGIWAFQSGLLTPDNAVVATAQRRLSTLCVVGRCT